MPPTFKASAFLSTNITSAPTLPLETLFNLLLLVLLFAFCCSPANIMPSPFSTLYGATKAMVTHFASSLACELGPEGEWELVIVVLTTSWGGRMRPFPPIYTRFLYCSEQLA